MKTIEKNQLIEYLKHGIEVVGELYALERIVNDYKAACARSKPVLVEKTLPDRPITQPSKGTKAEGTTWFVLGGLTLAIVIPAWSLLGSDDSNAFMNLLNGFMGFLFFFLLLGGIALIILGISQWGKAQNMSSSNDYALSNYEKQRLYIIEENKQRQEKYRRDSETWSTSQINGLNYLKSKLEEIEKVIDEYFSVNIIFPKYISLVALSSFYEYLSSGRCEELTGPNGAYNLFEAESRQNIIITQLDTIISNLEQIRQNQYILYEELKKTTGTLNQISSDLSVVRDIAFDLREIASLNLYYNSVTAANTSALAFLETVR